MIRTAIGDRSLATVRTIHRTAGIVAAPLVIVIGLSGLYLNNARVFDDMLSTEKRVIEKSARPWSLDQADARAEAILGGPVREIKKRRKMGRLYYRIIDKPRKHPGLIIETATHTYWMVTRYSEVHYDDAGKRLERRWFPRRIAKDLHSGRVLGLAGKLIVDLLSLCLVVFGISGPIIWMASRRR